MKTNNNIEYWDLIAKYYSNECSQDEKDELMNWVNENNENKILFDQIKQDLEIINLNKSMNKVNVDSAWEKVKNRILEDEDVLPEFNVRSTKVIRFSAVMRYAAVLIILIGIGFLSTHVYQKINGGEISEYAAVQEQGKEVVLPDGTVVTLNSESKLEYPKKFASNERRIKLQGEAFFNVTKNPDKPFIIETKNAEVKVLGTSFNVNAKLPDDQVEVFVRTGIVQLSDSKDQNKNILIKPGDVGVINSKNLYKSVNKNENIISWKTKEIIFNEQYLSNVISTLNKVYNTNIVCEDQSVLNLRYTSTFRDQEIDSILNVICLTFDLKMDKKDNNIYLVKH